MNIEEIIECNPRGERIKSLLGKRGLEMIKEVRKDLDYLFFEPSSTGELNKLEHRLKIWNHLAVHGDLALSDAWYLNDKQMIFWTKISNYELYDRNSNATREMALITKLLSDDSISDKFYKKSLIIFDLGCGTGIKANHVLSLLSTSLAYYVPYDSSSPLIQKTLESLRPFSSIEYCDVASTFSNFYRIASENKITECIDYLKKKVSELPALLDDWLKDPVIQNFYDFSMKEYKRIKELKKSYKNYLMEIKKARDLSQERVKCLDQDIEKFWKKAKNSSQLQKKLFSLYERYNPDIVDTLRRYLNCVKEIGAYNNSDPKKIFIKRFHTSHMFHLEIEKLLADTGLIPNLKLFKYKPVLENNSRIVLNPGLHADFFQNHCAEISYLRNNANKILDRIKINNDEQLNLSNPIGLVMLLGQTLGNFTPKQQAELMQNLYVALRPGDYFLLGVELRPSKESPAYNSNINELVSKYRNQTSDMFLRVITRLLGIPDDSIEFDARFKDNTIQMFYRVTSPEGLKVNHPEDPTRSIYFKKNTEILTATSYKFERSEIEKLLTDAKFKIEYMPDRTDYAVVLARK